MVGFLRVAWMPVNRVLARIAGILVVVAALCTPGLVAADIIIPLQDHGEMTLSLERVLVERGWEVTAADDGSILLYPRHVDAASVKMFASENKLQQRVINSVENPVIDILFWQTSLESHGWNVEQQPGGSLLLIPGAKERVTERPVSSASPAKRIPAVIDLAALRNSLIQHGWRAEHDLERGLFLIPGVLDHHTLAAANSQLYGQHPPWL